MRLAYSAGPAIASAATKLQSGRGQCPHLAPLGFTVEVAAGGRRRSNFGISMQPSLDKFCRRLIDSAIAARRNRAALPRKL
jgi:hypothetical protein